MPRSFTIRRSARRDSNPSKASGNEEENQKLKISKILTCDLETKETAKERHAGIDTCFSDDGKECKELLPNDRTTLLSFSIDKILELSSTDDMRSPGKNTLSEHSSCNDIHGRSDSSPVLRDDNIPNYECHQCGKVFKTQYTFARHMKMPQHTRERPFVCPTCGKGFRLSSTLSRHKIIHTNRRPFVCHFRKKAFNGHSTLNKYYKTPGDLVTESGEMNNTRPYQRPSAHLAIRNDDMINNTVYWFIPPNPLSVVHNYGSQIRYLHD